MMFDTLWWVVPTISIAFTKKAQAQNVKCHDDFSCFNETLIPSNGSVECYGYFSCSNCSTIRISHDNSIRCHGGFSCINSHQVDYNYVSMQNNIHCYGLSSCSNVYETAPGLHNGNGEINCYGERSCANSWIWNNGDDDGLECFGCQSCAHCFALIEYSIIVGGHLGLWNTTLNSAGGTDDTIYFIFYARDSGSGANIVCGNADHICNVLCYSNACNDLSISSIGTLMYVL